MIDPRRYPWILLLGTAVAACASSGGNATPRVDQDRITFEIDDPRVRAGENLYTLLGRERPRWLTTRGSASSTDTTTVVVYRDGGRFGGPESLRQIPAVTVGSVQFLSASDATIRFGLNHRHGAILVMSRRR
jgi:hypothetical protein